MKIAVAEPDVLIFPVPVFASYSTAGAMASVMVTYHSAKIVAMQRVAIDEALMLALAET